jgi:hypothetical protein
MTTQPQAGDMRPQAGDMQPQPGDTEPRAGDTQPQAGESKESKAQGTMTRWPRDLTDLWAGWQPFGAMNWPSVIKVRRIRRWRATGGQG